MEKLQENSNNSQSGNKVSLQDIYFEKNDYDQIFKTQISRAKFKQVINNIYEKTESLDEFRIELEENKKFLIDNFLYTTQYIDTDFTYEIIKDSVDKPPRMIIDIKQIENENYRKEVNRLKLQSLIHEKKYKKQSELMVKKEMKKLTKSKNVSTKMIDMYIKVSQKFPKSNINSPIDILNDLDNAKIDFLDYMNKIIQQEIEPYDKQLLLKNEYTDYMSLMTGIPVIFPKQLEDELNNPGASVYKPT
jgi:hypothetical protein